MNSCALNQFFGVEIFNGVDVHDNQYNCSDRFPSRTLTSRTQRRHRRRRWTSTCNEVTIVGSSGRVGGGLRDTCPPPPPTPRPPSTPLPPPLPPPTPPLHHGDVCTRSYGGNHTSTNNIHNVPPCHPPIYEFLCFKSVFWCRDF